VGRALVALFDADRASLLTDLIVGVIGEFDVDISEMHNDSTSVSVHGRYETADGTPRRGQAHGGGHLRSLQRSSAGPEAVGVDPDRLGGRVGAHGLPLG
jgi:hypothetical protein